MINSNIIQLVIGVSVAILVLSIGIFIASPVYDLTIEQQIMIVNCCNSTQCTDVSYNQETNTCILVLCYYNPVGRLLDNCTYQGLNKTVDIELISKV